MENRDKNIIAKSLTKETLIEHTIRSIECAKMLIKELGIKNKTLQDILIISVAFHDIGKCINDFQDYLQNGKEKHLAHNVISYKILNEYINVSPKCVYMVGFLPEYIKQIISKAVLFHHPLPVDKEKYTHSLNEIDGVDKDDHHIIVGMCDSIIKIINPILNDYIIEVKEPCDSDSCNDFSYYMNAEYERPYLLFNSFLTVCNGVLRFADILASSNDTPQKCVGLNDDILPTVYSKPDGYDNRFYEHKKYADMMCSGNVFEIVAPTGYGKTMINILWSLKMRRKVFYAAPTNEIARSNYNSIMKELKALGLDEKITVGLLLTNKWQFGGDLKDENDIIITNIDNYTRPLFKCDGHKSMCFDLVYRTVIFDEYHQYMSDSAIMSVFEIVMCARSFCENTKTLLTSATPNKYLYENAIKKAGVKMNTITVDFEEYGMKTYTFEFRNYDPSKDVSNFAMIVNAIPTSQKKCKKGMINFHSRYTEKDKKQKRDHIIRLYGASTAFEGEKTPICCTNILSTGMDISFEKQILCGLPLVEIKQSGGRVNRWGEYPNGGTIVISNEYNNEKHEKCAIESKYSPELCDLEYKMLRENLDGKTVTLNEFYAVIDKICEDGEWCKRFKRLIEKKKKNSYKNLSNMDYTYSQYNTNDNVEYISTLPTIRTDKINENGKVSIFVTVPDKIGEYISVDIDNGDLINGAMHMYDVINKKKLSKKHGGNYPNYETKYKNNDIAGLAQEYTKNARCSSTPYILTKSKNHEYHYTFERGLEKIQKK